MPALWYFPIEALKSRYTDQLSNQWMPEAIEAAMMNSYSEAGEKWAYVPVYPLIDMPEDVQNGVVLDSVARGLYSMAQCGLFLKRVQAGLVKSGDVIFLQDFFTPGFESILYALHMRQIDVRVYSTVYAQTFDEYDFTFPMRDWLRFIEIGLTNAHTGLIVASTVHKDMMQNAGVKAPIHVMGLAFGLEEVRARMPSMMKRKRVIYTSRIDAEKQPFFMLETAKRFLAEMPDYEWVLTTSRRNLVSNQPGVVEALRAYAAEESRFIIKENLSKNSYYFELSQACVQFNCALQDFVSYTLLEASAAGCDVCYPRFRSFPECVPADRLYDAFKVDSAVQLLKRCCAEKHCHFDIARKCDEARYAQARLLLHGAAEEINIWSR